MARKKPEPKVEPPKKAVTANPVAAWIDKINKSPQFRGSSQVRAARDMRTPYNLRRPTGVLSLDIALAGGLHAGGPIEIHGAESVGKTFLAYRTAGQVQRNYGERSAVLIFSTEIRLDKGFARRAGFQIAYGEDEIEELSTLRAARGYTPFTDEQLADLRLQTGEIVNITSSTADKGLEVALDGLASGLFQLFIIESLGAFLTPEVDEGAVGDAHYAGSSRVMTNFQNKVYPLFMLDRPDGTMLETTIIGINQARAKMDGGPRGPKTKAAAGAFAWKHGQLASIELSRGANLKESDEGPVIGKEIRWLLSKGKVGTHDGKKGAYNFFHVPRAQPVFWSEVDGTTGIDVYADVVQTAIDMGVVRMAGSWVSLADGTKFQGVQRLTTEVVKNPELAVQLRDECMKESGLLVRYT